MLPVVSPKVYKHANAPLLCRFRHGYKRNHDAAWQFIRSYSSAKYGIYNISQNGNIGFYLAVLHTSRANCLIIFINVRTNAFPLCWICLSLFFLGGFTLLWYTYFAIVVPRYYVSFKRPLTVVSLLYSQVSLAQTHRKSASALTPCLRATRLRVMEVRQDAERASIS